MRGPVDDELASNRLRRGAIGDMLTRQSRRRGSVLALVAVGEDGTPHLELTYAELERLSNRLAHRLLAAGAGRGSTVCTMGSNGPEMVLTYLATLKTGAVFSTINPALTVREVSHQLSLTRPAVVVHDVPVTATLRDAMEATDLAATLIPVDRPDGGRRTGVTGVWGLIDGTDDGSATDLPPAAIIEDDDPAMVIFTSGTERLPKGVTVSHRAFLMSTTPGWAYTRYVVEDDVFLLLAPLYTMAGVGTVTNLVSVGATIVLVPRPDPDLVLDVIERLGVTNMAQTPTFYRRLVASPRFGSTDMRSLQQCHVYGGLVTEHVIMRIREAAPESTWATYWGQTELSQLGTIGFFRSLDEVPDGDLRWIGRPVPQVEVRVVDADDNDVAVGELVCRGPGVMLGYLGAPEETSRAIRDGWLRTGDLVRMSEDGDLFFLDRLKDVIKTGGMNVSSLEVEQAIARDGAVREVAVVGVPDEVWGEAVVALVVLADAGATSDEDARTGVLTRCRTHLAPYKVPKRVHFVTSLPHDAQGKVRKREVRAVVQDIESRAVEPADATTR